jgi:hypothetical protein
MAQTTNHASSLQNRGAAEAETAASGGAFEGATKAELDDELVRRIADRVYQCLMHDLKIERERRGLVSKKQKFHKGGR